MVLGKVPDILEFKKKKNSIILSEDRISNVTTLQIHDRKTSNLMAYLRSYCDLIVRRLYDVI